MDVDRQLAALENAENAEEAMSSPEYAYLSKVQEDGYKLYAKAAGQIITLPIKPDTKIETDTILYMYIPEGTAMEENITESYDVIVPMSALIKLTGDKHLVYFAVPLTGKGEAGQYRVVSTEVKLLASDGTYAAIDAVIRDGRQVIVSYEKPIRHMQKVRVG